MSRQAYPLQAVEDLRERRRDRARTGLAALLEAVAAAQREADEADARLRRTKADLDAARRGLYDPPADGGALDVAAIDARQRGIEALGRRLAERRGCLARRRRELDAARADERRGREELVTAMRELEAIGKHRARWRRRIELEERRREARATDEIVASAFARAGAEAGGEEAGGGEGR